MEGGERGGAKNTHSGRKNSHKSQWTKLEKKARKDLLPAVIYQWLSRGWKRWSKRHLLKNMRVSNRNIVFRSRLQPVLTDLSHRRFISSKRFRAVPLSILFLRVPVLWQREEHVLLPMSWGRLTTALPFGFTALTAKIFLDGLCNYAPKEALSALTWATTPEPWEHQRFKAGWRWSHHNTPITTTKLMCAPPSKWRPKCSPWGRTGPQTSSSFSL